MRPPAHSAVRVGGERLYERARRGEEVEAPERVVSVSAFELLEFVSGDFPIVRADITCSKGTYVRSLAEMVGQRLGCGGYLSALLRTRVGPHAIEQSCALEALSESTKHALLSPLQGLPHLPQVQVGPQERLALTHGNSVSLPDPPTPGPVAVLDEAGELVCIGRFRPADGRLWPDKVIATN